MDPKEIDRRWTIIFGVNWNSINRIFEYKPKGEEEWWNLPPDERLPIRGTLVSIEPFADKAVVKGSGCYKYQPWDSRKLPREENLTLELPWREIMPEAHGDMLWVTHTTAQLIVFGVARLFKN